MRYLLPFFLLFVAACGDRTQQRAELTSMQNDVVRAVQEIDSMRSARAATIGDETVDFDTFARVCPPVGRRAAEIAAANGWEFKQLSTKNRNPAHYPDSSALSLIRRFEEDSDLEELWVQTNGGLRYLHRITIEESCLACHGPEEARPAFVLERYPDDRAFGYEVGDFRGVYSVVIPDSALGS